MAVKDPAADVALNHCHEVESTPPSGSVNRAVTSTPACGVVADNATEPCSSTLMTSIVTVIVSVKEAVSVAVTITSYEETSS